MRNSVQCLSGYTQSQREREGGGEREGGRERERDRERERESEREREILTSFLMSSLHDWGRNLPLEAGKTPMSCSRGAKGTVPLSKSLRTFLMFLKSDANGA